MTDDAKDATKKQEHSIDTAPEGTEKKPIEFNFEYVVAPSIGMASNMVISNVAGGPVGYYADPATYIDENTLFKYRDLEREVADLKRKVDEQAQTLRAEKLGSEEKQKQLQALRQNLEQLSEKERLSFLLTRVNQEAQRTLLTSADFRSKFATNSECSAFVMSVDIRRSTELMLKARKAEQFASCITTLCNDLTTAVIECYGVVDKFTGDGILGFFPEFFSGPDAGYYSLLAADRCHTAFQKTVSGVPWGIQFDSKGYRPRNRDRLRRSPVGANG
jgi:hypothetical protein